MNLLVGFVILLCLGCSQLQQPDPVSDLGWRLTLIGLTSALVPGLAVIQTLVVSQRQLAPDRDPVDRQNAIERLTTCHTAVWLAASLATIYVWRWHEIVRVNWGWQDFVLLDDLLILLPVVMSLVASWAVFYELQGQKANSEPHADERRAPSSSQPTKWFAQARQRLRDRGRLEFVSLRFRVQFLILALPIMLAIILCDVAGDSTAANGWPYLLSLGVGGLALAATFPWYLGLIWRNAPLPSLLADQLEPELAASGYDTKQVRIWNSNRQAVNALVVGIFPRWRRIFLSDRLVELFPPDEIRAIVRHELGHSRQHHALVRTVFLLLPIVCLAGFGQILIGTPLVLEYLCDHRQWPLTVVAAASLAAFAAYAITVLGWLSRAMEFEADAIACCQSKTTARGCHEWVYCGDQTETTRESLLRLAACHPGMLHRSSWFYPSLLIRIGAIDRLSGQTDIDKRLKQLATGRTWAATLIAGILLALVTALRIWG